MLPPFVGTVFINDLSNATGWSQNYFPSGTTTAVALPQMVQLVDKLRDMLPTAYQIVFARLDVPRNPRDSIIVDVPYPVVGTLPGGLSPQLLPPDTCFLLRLFGSALQKNRKFMRGMWQQDISEGTAFTPSAGLVTALTAFEALLVSSFLVGSLNAVTNYSTACLSVTQDAVLRNRKTGRPFGLARGRRRRPM